jgi:hypothetical protein
MRDVPATLVRATGLGPTILPSGEKGAVTLRIFNPDSALATATVGGQRVTIDAGDILEMSGLTGDVLVRSFSELLVTTRVSDVPATDAVNASHDAQLPVRSLHAATHAVAPQACAPTVQITTSSQACKYGTSSARVPDAGPGATYQWSGDSIGIVEGQGTNLIKFTLAGTTSAAVTVTVTANGCTQTGAATVNLREPFGFSSIAMTPTSPRTGTAVRIDWAYTTSETPKTQRITLTSPTGVATVVNVPLADRSYGFVAGITGTWTADVYGSLIGGRRRACCSSPGARPAASSCATDTHRFTFTVQPPCDPPNGAVSIGSPVDQSATVSGTIAANGSWTLTSDRGNPLFPSSGSGNATFSYTATNAGNDTLRLTISGCGTSVQRTASVAVIAAPPTVTLAADTTNVWFGGSTTLHAMIGNAPNTSATTYVITSSKGNSINGATGTGSGAKTATYIRDEGALDDTVTITVTAPNGTASASLVIQNTQPCTTTPTLSNVSVSPTSVAQGGTATIQFTVSGDVAIWTVNSDLGNPITPSSGYLTTGTFTVQYRATVKGTDTIRIQVDGRACGSVTRTLPFTVN